MTEKTVSYDVMLKRFFDDYNKVKNETTKITPNNMIDNLNLPKIKESTVIPNVFKDDSVFIIKSKQPRKGIDISTYLHNEPAKVLKTEGTCVLVLFKGKEKWFPDYMIRVPRYQFKI